MTKCFKLLSKRVRKSAGYLMLAAGYGKKRDVIATTQQNQFKLNVDVPNMFSRESRCAFFITEIKVSLQWPLVPLCIFRRYVPLLSPLHEKTRRLFCCRPKAEAMSRAQSTRYSIFLLSLMYEMHFLLAVSLLSFFLGFWTDITPKRIIFSARRIFDAYDKFVTYKTHTHMEYRTMTPSTLLTCPHRPFRYLQT